jgi:DNA-directed RNA polymerase subunit RPC12/RpoP
MRCPKCGSKTLEVLNDNEELLYLCEECEILISGDEEDYEITKLYGLDDLEFGMLYHDDLVLKEITGNNSSVLENIFFSIT